MEEIIKIGKVGRLRALRQRLATHSQEELTELGVLPRGWTSGRKGYRVHKKKKSCLDCHSSFKVDDPYIDESFGMPWGNRYKRLEMVNNDVINYVCCLHPNHIVHISTAETCDDLQDSPEYIYRVIQEQGQLGEFIGSESCITCERGHPTLEYCWMGFRISVVCKLTDCSNEMFKSCKRHKPRDLSKYCDP